MKFTCDKIVLLLWLMTCCTPSSSGNENPKSRLFDHNLSSSMDNLQSWQDWLSKRGLGSHHWNVGELPGGTFQNWQELKKRGWISPSSGLGKLGLFDNSKYQEWNDWVSKRDASSGSPFAGFNDFDKSQFQQWSDWVSKRNYDMGVGFGHGPSSMAGYQNWADFAKRQSFVFPSSGLGMAGNVQFQDWQDWVKRMGPENLLALRGYQLGNKDRFIKRQLGFSPDRYGSFSRYFTDGLQDWRATFRNSKRGKEQGEKPSGEQ